MNTYFVELVYTYHKLFIPCFAVALAVGIALLGLLLSRWFPSALKRGYINVEAVEKLLPIRKTVYKIISKYTAEKPLEKKIEQIIEREISK